MATSTRSRSTAAPSAKQVTAKKAAAKSAAGAKSASRAGAVKTATKTAARAPGATTAAAKKAAAKKAAPKTTTTTKSKRPPKPVTFEGKPAKNRHFEVSMENFEAAKARADQEGAVISDVMRAGLREYAKKTPAAAKRAEKQVLTLPPVGVRGLKTVFKSGRSEMISGYMAALASAGWPLQVIANAVLDAGLAPTMTRQAVSLRVNKANNADGGLPEGLPDVPSIGVRRPYPANATGGGTKALSLTKSKRMRSNLKDVTMRITDEDYEAIQPRLKYEGTKVAALIDDLLGRYASGDFNLPKVRH